MKKLFLFLLLTSCANDFLYCGCELITYKRFNDVVIDLKIEPTECQPENKIVTGDTLYYIIKCDK